MRQEFDSHINITEAQSHQLDEDVLHEIFRIATDEETEPVRFGSHLLHFPETLLLVCRRWKWMAEFNPVLWTRIRCDEAHGTERLERWLVRSGESALRLVWSWPPSLDSEALEVVRDEQRALVREHRRRLGSFHLNSQDMHEYEYIYGSHFLRSFLHDTPIMRSLKLDHVRWTPLPGHGEAGNQRFALPSITTFGARDCSLTWLWTMENLRELRLERLEMMHCDFLFFFLQSSPRLEVLEVVDCRVNRKSRRRRGDGPVPVLDMLHTLRVVEWHGAYFVCHSLLEFLRAPNVVTLELDCSEPGPPTPTLATFVLAAKSTLRHLTLRCIDALEGDIESFLEDPFPHLETLSLYPITPDEPYVVTEEMLGLMNRCPNLQSLVLVGVVFPSPMGLLRLVKDRMVEDGWTLLKELCISPWPDRSVKSALEELGVDCVDDQLDGFGRAIRTS